MADQQAEDDEWAKEQGVPSYDEPFIQKYLEGRDALITQEKKQRSDFTFRETLSSMAAEASSIVSQIRYEEQQTIWTKEYEDTLATDGEVYPGMMFHLAQERMEKTRLWKIVKRMPKGALLHCHLEAMVDLDWLFEEMFTVGGFHISADAIPDAESDWDGVQLNFRWLSTSAKYTAPLWDKDYQANEWIPVEEAAKAFPQGDRAGFVAWLKQRSTITLKQSLNHHHGPNDVWQKFQSCFEIVSGLLHYEPMWRGFIVKVLQNLLEDGVQYADIRAAFVVPVYRTGSEAPEDDSTLLFQILDEEIKAFSASDKGKGFWGARLIYTSIRHFDTRPIIESMQECIRVKEQFPDLIAGYDLVGQEDLGRSLADLTPELFWFKKTCAQQGLDIPFFFHAGETLGDGTETDENLFDAILLASRRIGHGFSLYKHPLLIDMVKEKRICIESCPISNEVLRLTGSVMSHPLPALLSRGVPVALCNDDPAVFGQSAKGGMTYDFWQALQGWENLGLEGLGSLAENSVRYATFEDYSQKDWIQELRNGAFGKGVRSLRMRAWAAQWEKYCQWIVKEFGPDLDLEPDE